MRIAPISPSAVIPVLFLNGCASPLSPAFDAGPDGDLVAGLFAVLLLGGLFYRIARAKPDEECQGSSAGRIVRGRYARGEMTREEDQHMRRDLFTPIDRIK
jgi:hypothetical protein